MSEQKQRVSPRLIRWVKPCVWSTAAPSQFARATRASGRDSAGVGCPAQAFWVCRVVGAYGHQCFAYALPIHTMRKTSIFDTRISACLQKVSACADCGAFPHYFLRTESKMESKFREKRGVWAANSKRSAQADRPHTPRGLGKAQK